MTEREAPGGTEFALRVLLARAVWLLQEGTSNALIPELREEWNLKREAWLSEYGLLPGPEWPRRCWCGRPVPESSSDGIHCAEHD